MTSQLPDHEEFLEALWNTPPHPFRTSILYTMHVSFGGMKSSCSFEVASDPPTVDPLSCWIYIWPSSDTTPLSQHKYIWCSQWMLEVGVRMQDTWPRVWGPLIYGIAGRTQRLYLIVSVSAFVQAAEQGHLEVCELLVSRCPILRTVKDRRSRLPVDLCPENRSLLELLNPW